MTIKKMNKIVPFKQIIRLSLLMVYKLINDQNILFLLGREKGGGVGGTKYSCSVHVKLDDQLKERN